MMNLDKTLMARSATHGKFSNNAQVAQAMRSAVELGTAWHDATDVQKESVHNIIGKIARLVSGDPSFEDSWADIAGYAKLAYDETMNIEETT